MANIQNFTDLIAWQKNHEIALIVYNITKNFPKEEAFGLTSQIRKSVSSITANIAEGYGRYHYKDKMKFYFMARGSNTETQNYIILAKDLDYIEYQVYKDLFGKLQEGHRLINGLIKSSANFNN